MTHYLIVGASGTVGSRIAQALQSPGNIVRGITSKRDRKSDGIEWVHADLSTQQGLKEAFEGVDRAFFLSPPGYADQFRILSPLIQEAKRRGLKKVVLMTALGANATETSPMRRAEVELEKSGIPFNIIRPNWFMQNFNTFWAQGIREQGKILLPAGKAKVSFIDARDIADAATRLLTRDDLDNQAFDLTGPEALTHDEAATALSKATGKKIAYEEIRPETLGAALRGGGVPGDYADFMLLIFGFLREGYNAGVTDNVQKLLGKPARTLAAYAADHRKTWE